MLHPPLLTEERKALPGKKIFQVKGFSSLSAA